MHSKVFFLHLTKESILRSLDCKLSMQIAKYSVSFTHLTTSLFGTGSGKPFPNKLLPMVYNHLFTFACNQDLARLTSYMDESKLEISMKLFITSQFHYYPLYGYFI